MTIAKCFYRSVFLNSLNFHPAVQCCQSLPFFRNLNLFILFYLLVSFWKFVNNYSLSFLLLFSYFLLLKICINQWIQRYFQSQHFFFFFSLIELSVGWTRSPFSIVFKGLYWYLWWLRSGAFGVALFVVKLLFICTLSCKICEMSFLLWNYFFLLEIKPFSSVNVLLTLVFVWLLVLVIYEKER